MIRVPNRDVLSVIAHSDQRAVRFFEDLTASANASEAAIAGMGGGAAVSGGFVMDDGTATLGGGFVLEEGGA